MWYLIEKLVCVLSDSYVRVHLQHLSLLVSVTVSVTVSLTVYLSLLNFKCQPNPDQYLLVAWTEWLCVFLQSSVALLMKWEQLALSISYNWLSVICITELDNYHGVPLTQILITTYMKIGGGAFVFLSFFLEVSIIHRVELFSDLSVLLHTETGDV